MKHSLLYFLFLLVATNLATAQQHNSASAQVTTLQDFSKFVGTYPCENGLLKSPVLLRSLRKILNSDYQAYRQHMKFAGCGAIERVDGFLLLDVSQLHVGGYGSMIFIREDDGAVYLFWLKSRVQDKEYAFYGRKPIPAQISHTVQSELNRQWGHVAHFTVSGEKIDIQMNPS